MGTLFFHEMKKQASGFLKEKIRNARLALTDVTPAELMTEEATNGNPWGPDAKTMGFISRAAFEVDDYWRIVDILHKKLSSFDRRHWREPYKALLLLEHLLTHGPESVAEEFQSDKEVVEEMGGFQYIDERGFNWGLTVRKKSERISKLLEKGPLLKEERDRARKITRGIQGFGSFNQKPTSADRSGVEQSSDWYWRSNSHYEDFYNKQEDAALENQKEKSSSHVGLDDAQIIKKTETGKDSTKEKNASNKSLKDGEEANTAVKIPPPEESKPLLARREDEPKIELQVEDHPYNNLEHQRMESMILLSRA